MRPLVARLRSTDLLGTTRREVPANSRLEETVLVSPRGRKSPVTILFPVTLGGRERRTIICVLSRNLRYRVANLVAHHGDGLFRQTVEQRRPNGRPLGLRQRHEQLPRLLCGSILPVLRGYSAKEHRRKGSCLWSRQSLQLRTTAPRDTIFEQE